MKNDSGYYELIMKNERSLLDDLLSTLQSHSQSESFISRNVTTNSTYAKFSQKRDSLHLYSNNEQKKVIIVTNDQDREAVWKSDDRGVLKFYGETSRTYVTPIDISRDGTRWDGPGVGGNPCGYGSWMDGNDNCLYEGVMVGKKEAFIGKKFYKEKSDIDPEYEGFLFGEKKYGRGKQMDRHGNIDYDGYFHDGKPFNPDKIALPFISSMVKEIDITDGIICDPQTTKLHLPKWLIHLQKIHIGNDSFEHVRYLTIDGLPELTECIIGEQGQDEEDESFGCGLTCCICNCKKLAYLEFGNHSKKKCEALKLSHLPSLEDISLRSSSFGVATCLSIQNCKQLKAITIGENCFNGQWVEERNETVDGMNA